MTTMNDTRPRHIDKRILIADDFFTMRGILKRILKELGYNQVEEAENGQIALCMLRAQSYDCLITDWNMPELSGIELLKQIRQDEQLKKLPVIIITAEAKRDQILEAVEQGVSGYIVKPFTVNSFKEKMDKIFPPN